MASLAVGLLGLVQIDVRSEEAIFALAEECGPIDILVNAAEGVHAGNVLVLFGILKAAAQTDDHENDVWT